MFTAASRYLLRRSATSFRTTSTSFRSMSALTDQFKEYGKMVFTGKVADGYLRSHGASADILKDPTWVNHSSDIVAAAVFDWYVLRNALCVCVRVAACNSKRVLCCWNRYVNRRFWLKSVTLEWHPTRRCTFTILLWDSLIMNGLLLVLNSLISVSMYTHLSSFFSTRKQGHWQWCECILPLVSTDG